MKLEPGKPRTDGPAVLGARVAGDRKVRPRAGRQRQRRRNGGISAWKSTGRDDLSMRISVWNELGPYIGTTTFSIEVSSSTYRREQGGWAYDVIYFEHGEAKGWGNRFHKLMENLLVDVHNKTGFGFTKRTGWGSHYYYPGFTQN